jgi:hypothetical protein
VDCCLSQEFTDELNNLEGQPLINRFKEYYPELYQNNIDNCGGAINNNFPSDEEIRSIIVQNILENHVTETIESTKIPQSLIDIFMDL